MKTGGNIRLFLLIPGNILALGLVFLGAQTRAANLLGWFLLLFGVLYLAGSMIFFLPKNAPLVARAGLAAREEAGDRSFWLIVPGFLAVFFASPLEYLYLGGDARAGIYLQAIGLFLIALGLAVRIWTRQTLKGQYTGHVQITAGSGLQTGGPYRYVRHPGYTGYLLMCLGIAAGFGSLLGAAGIFLILLPGLYYRMGVEEKLLAEHFGEAYRAYARRTKRLLPGIL